MTTICCKETHIREIPWNRIYCSVGTKRPLSSAILSLIACGCVYSFHGVVINCNRDKFAVPSGPKKTDHLRDTGLNKLFRLNIGFAGGLLRTL